MMAWGQGFRLVLMGLQPTNRHETRGGKALSPVLMWRRRLRLPARCFKGAAGLPPGAERPFGRVFTGAVPGARTHVTACLRARLGNGRGQHRVENTGRNGSPRRAEARRQSRSFDPTADRVFSSLFLHACGHRNAVERDSCRGPVRSASRARSGQAKPPVPPSIRDHAGVLV